MSKSINGAGVRPTSVGLQAILAMCVLFGLVVGPGYVRAVDTAASVDTEVASGDEGPGAQQLSLGKPNVIAPGNGELLSPNSGLCTGPVVLYDGSASVNGRAPTANYAAVRGHYLILQSELAAAGITGTTTISGIGFRYDALPGVAATAPLKIYLENAAGSVVANAKSATWATAISTMALVHNTSTTLPNSTTPYDITFSVGSFTYTGGALYVAYDWGPYAGPFGTGTDVSCNSTAVASRERAANSAAATLGALSPFGPETRLTATVGSNDASVTYVISLGSLARPLVGPQTVQAVVTNKGANVINNLPVGLTIAGVDIFSNTQTVATLAACGGTATVTFAPFTPTGIGSDTVTASVPADDNNANNSASRPLNETYNLYSYKHPGTTAAGGFGVGGNTADFAAKFTTTAAAKVSAISIEFPLTSATTYRVALYPDSGTGTPGLVPLYEDATDRTVTVAGPVTITLPTPVAVGPGAFFAAVEQTNTTNVGLGFDNETPIRAGAFYLAIPHPATAWTDFAPGNNFKPNIGVTLIQCATVADCNDNNLCTDDACTNNLCVHTNNNATECDNNTCSSPDVCSNGVCTPGPNPCNDNNACTVDNCVQGGGCNNVAVNCDDNNPCTNDSCDPATGCVHVNNTAACTDNNPCTVGDACSNGVCVPGTGALSAPVHLCNAGTITINDAAAATPYPSSIVVAGQPSYVCSVTVELNGIAHTFPDDIDILLARTAGSNAIVMSDVGGGTGVTGLNLTLSDAAAASLPDAGPLVSGTFKPTNIGGGDTFPAPAPTPTGGSALSAFTGTNPNGSWDLWVVDDAGGDVGSIANGWCVNIVSACQGDADCGDGNPCTNDACVGGVCTHTNNTNPCDDNNACTANDTCTNGVCVGSAPPSCDDGNACTSNICNAQTGLCENPPIVCNDNNTCTDDTCNPASGCVYTANDANTCTDNSLCTSPDVCQNGVCVGQNPVVCTPDANICTTEACDPATGLCVSTNNTGPCSDGNPCTTGDKCGPALSENFDGVTAPNLPAGWSSSSTGGSPWATVSTSNDTAPNSAFGVDGGSTADEVLLSPVINIATASAQLSFRTRWTFEGTSTFYDGAVLEIAIGGGAFTDIVGAGGSFVTGGYTGTIFTGDTNPLAGRSAWTGVSAGYPAYLTTVVNLPAAAAGQTVQLQWRVGSDSLVSSVGQNIDTVLLLDGNANSCQPGTGTLNCDDNNPCTDDYCDPQSGCQHAANNVDCDDNNACTTLDTCNNGTCSGTPVDCNDFNPCTTDTCLPASGCTFTANTLPCSDGNACTTGDACGNGVCNPGTAVVCNDNNVCTTDSCNPNSGCVFTNNAASCNDNNACTTNDVCSGGTCSGTAITCNDNNVCTTDSCNPATGCVFTNNTASCNDNNACTTNDVCSGGTCSGTAITCNDNNVCTTDSCNPATGCVFANNTNGCDDGNPCTVGDTCGNGVCNAGTAVPAPAEATGVGAAADKTTFSWTAVPSATRYDVVRGSLGGFPVGSGAESCFDNLGGPSLSDAMLPGAGAGFWYLPRGENACGNGPYGTQGVNGTPGAPRLTTTCP